jgi:hypothetical protein
MLPTNNTYSWLLRAASSKPASRLDDEICGTPGYTYADSQLPAAKWPDD